MSFEKQNDQLKIYYSTYTLPLAQLYIASSPKGICALSLTNSSNFFNWLNRHFSDYNHLHCQKYHQAVFEQLQEYLAAKRHNFEVTLDLQGTDFQKKVWKKLLQIPYGKTTTYKELALQIGGANYARAVGRANNQNPISILIPCHRVIGSNGKLTGYAAGLEIKRKLLQLESAQTSLL
ncbi:methylated-DNA--[protein]-cysteine S-methyltransferase [Sporohalobacter salinus]|uniref:methylated-DNA--[protein]-cysteine S-methyltransferase n=1 Tax=Sporohalobacter salinus TaxID=1494606 RepID=UPI001961B8E3|nr:methylated-DNA--[protein]-cysteine S-methyltransferase [Sporohalobacter salinus]MBM7624397.1 O-6-methylguanine DNA methyltransferase [Sporohalobacter salinus]